RPAGMSLARIRQPPIVPLTGWPALAPHASSGSNGTMMTALSRGPSAMTARKRCEDMTPSWHDGGDGERSVRSGQSGSADQQSSRHESAPGQGQKSAFGRDTAKALSAKLGGRADSARKCLLACRRPGAAEYPPRRLREMTWAAT